MSRSCAVWIATLGWTVAVGMPLSAQSLTSGSLGGRVVSDRQGVGGVHLTLESRAGGAIRDVETGPDGTFRIPLLAPGEYRLLAELAGYQPVRRTGVVVSAARTTTVEISIVRRPPPITTVDEVGGVVTQAGGSAGRIFRARDPFDPARRWDASDLGRGATEVVAALDGREGLGLAASGRPIAESRLFVDGVLQSFLRHPGYPDEPPRTAGLPRDAVGQAQIIGVPLDAEWRGGPGSILALATRAEAGKIRFQPNVSYAGATLGGRSADNPADSVASSFQVGATLSGTLKPDTAHFLLRFDYQQLQQPSAGPWERDSAVFQGQAVGLAKTIGAIAVDSFGAQVGGLVAPVVRTYKGGSGFGRLDLLVGSSSTLAARAGFSSWKERGWALGDDLPSGAGTELDARDGSGAVTITSTGTSAANEFRVGFSLARREFTGTSVAHSMIVANGAGFGTPAGIPGTFDHKVFDLSNAYQRRFGDHRLKVGIGLSVFGYSQDYRYGASGSYVFGDIGGFAMGRGSYFGLAGPAEIAQFSTRELGVFLQDSWQVTPEIQFQLGVRYDRQFLPSGKIVLNDLWRELTGVRNDSFPADKSGLSPRVSFVWDVQNRGEWIVRGGGGVYYGRLEAGTLSEAILFDQNVIAHRALGDFAVWPAIPDAALAPAAGQRLTVIGSGYRNPRSGKYEFGVSRRLPGAMLHLTGSYQHTDYLLRRQDLNRAAQVGTTQEGRPVFGTLAQRAALVTPVVGSNHRFSEFDLVSGLAPTGFADHYEASALLERPVSDRVSFVAAYTYSRTTDNLMGARSADPADQLSPFPDDPNGVDWTRGRSDFDVPHRAVVSAGYRSSGSSQLGLSARYRIQSGLPFTPGFRPGVDINADGSGNNDPAFLGGGVTGLAEALAGASCAGAGSGFSARNACRAKMQQALDLSASLSLSLGSSSNRVLLRIDAFNVVATESGLVDRALVLVDPAGSLTTSPSGNVIVPLVANAKFGSLLVRRGEPRMVRVGLSVEY